MPPGPPRLGLSIGRAAFILALGNVGSRLLGLVREQVIAALFGASAATDAFTAAARIPTSLYDLLIGGLISAALVPVFSGYAGRDEEQHLWRVASAVLNTVMAAVLVCVALLVAAAPWVVDVYATGFSRETRDLAVELVRYMLPSLAFMAVAGVLTALHYARRRFTLPAVALSLYNLGIILAAVVFHSSLAVGSLVAGVLLGALLQALALGWGLRDLRYTWRAGPWSPGVREVLGLYLPVALGLVVSAVGVAIDSNLASRTGEGNLAAMRFATTLVQFPLGLVAFAVSTAVLPILSRQAGAPVLYAAPVDGEPVPGRLASAEAPVAPQVPAAPPADASAFVATLGLGLRLVLLAILPAVAGLVALRLPIVQLLFERGAFSPFDTERTALALLAYAPGIAAAAVDQVLIFSFYARKNTVTPVLVGVVGVGIYLAVALLLIGPLGMPGLALANSAQWVAHALVLLFLLRRALGSLAERAVLPTLARALLASLAMGGLLWAVVEGGLGALATGESLLRLPVVLGLVGLGGGTYVAVLWLLRAEEVSLLLGALRRR